MSQVPEVGSAVKIMRAVTRTAVAGLPIHGNGKKQGGEVGWLGPQCHPP